MANLDHITTSAIFNSNFKYIEDYLPIKYLTQKLTYVS